MTNKTKIPIIAAGFAISFIAGSLVNNSSNPPVGASVELPEASVANVLSKKVSTSTIDFIVSYKGITSTLSFSFDGYNSCRNGTWGTSTKAFCLEGVKKQIEGNLKAWKEGIDGQKVKETKVDYSDEITIKDLK